MLFTNLPRQRRPVARVLAFAAFCALASSLAPRAGASVPGLCIGDLDGDGQVASSDLASLLGSWGPCACPADLDADGAVRAADLAVLLGAWGPCPPFAYPPPAANPEAEQIGLEFLGPDGPLALPAAIYTRIDRDLALIRALTPALASESHTPAWSPSTLIVNLLRAAPHDQYDCLNTHFGVTQIDFLFASGDADWWVVHFPGAINIPAVAALYTAAPEIPFAEPDGIFGGENFWRPTDAGGGTWTWDIDDGFLDCFDGCDCHRAYTFETTGPGGVTQTSYTEFGQPWCKFGK